MAKSKAETSDKDPRVEYDARGRVVLKLAKDERPYLFTFKHEDQIKGMAVGPVRAILDADAAKRILDHEIMLREFGAAKPSWELDLGWISYSEAERLAQKYDVPLEEF